MFLTIFVSASSHPPDQGLGEGVGAGQTKLGLLPAWSGTAKEVPETTERHESPREVSRRSPTKGPRWTRDVGRVGGVGRSTRDVTTTTLLPFQTEEIVVEPFDGNGVYRFDTP